MSRGRVIPVDFDPVYWGVEAPREVPMKRYKRPFGLLLLVIFLPLFYECLWSGTRVWRQFAFTYTGATKQFEYDDTTQVIF